MSDETNQLSVAELLARNGQDVPASGGGRRRRSGRGIAVTELTGDLPAVREGASAHAAPEDPPPPAGNPAAAEPAYSLLSGPITFYDPLAETGSHGADVRSDPSGRDPHSHRASGSLDSAPHLGWAEHRGSTPAPHSSEADRHDRFEGPGVESSGGRRARRERIDSLSDQVSLAQLERAQLESGQMPSAADSGPVASNGLAASSTGSSSPSYPPANGLPASPNGAADDLAGDVPGQPNGLPTQLDERAVATDTPSSRYPIGRGGRRRRRDTDEQTTEVQPYRGPMPAPGTGPAAWASRGPERSDRPVDLDPRDPGRPPEPSRRNNNPAGSSVPAWSARRHQPPDVSPPGPDGAPTAIWSTAGRDQQWPAGPVVTGDLMRDAGERGDRPGVRHGSPARGPGVTELLDRALPDSGLDDPDLDNRDLLDPGEARTEFYEPYESDGAATESEDEQFELTGRLRVASRRTRAVPRRARESDDRAGQRQWLILGGQVAGAAVAGMLLFKGFETMWDLLPFVALALAVVVILGLVALVRVLRRTEDMYSTVIAVVVGIFVTLGPLAFLLSTN
jgi:hypothetical protein